MKKILILIIFNITAFLPLTAQSLVDAEYYFDSDPGVGNGVPLTIVSGDSIEETKTIDASALGPGFHNLFIRVRDDLGRWSLVRRHLFYIFDDTHVELSTTQADLAGFEYFFDRDKGAGTGIWVPSATGSELTQAVNFSTSGIGPGFHQLLVRAKDASGKWGQYSRHLFYVFDDAHIDLTKIRSKIVAAEYYFDKDTVPRGQGMGLNITEGNEVEWSGGIPVDGLTAGEHTLFIRVQDSAGMWSIVFAEQFSIVGLTTVTNSPICQGSSDGEATVGIIGGKPPFTYLWDDPEQQSGAKATGLKAGLYTVTVTDAEGAVIREQVEITEFDTIKIEIQTADTECKYANGSATAFVTGDNPPFDYVWAGGLASTEASIYNLRAGIYEVTVTDAEGCQNKALATISDRDGPQISVTTVQHLKCAGDANGIIVTQVTGGTEPYAISWSNGETSPVISNLKAGTYELTVIDDSTCMATKSIRVEQPQPITFSDSVVQADCGINNGSATVKVKGGTPDPDYGYYFNWTGFTAPHTAIRTELNAGVYGVTVSDYNGCSAIKQVVVSEKDAPSVRITSVTQSACGQNDGSILLAVLGDPGLYTYDWRRVETGSSVGSARDLTNVGPGTYSVSVSDGSGCKTFATATIPAEKPPTEHICLVSVDDSLNNSNLIIWNKTHGMGIVAYKLYRETTSAGVYDSIARIPFDSLSSFIDTLADPRVRSWRYKISAVNSCGVESRLSPSHKTMHLTINVGWLGEANLIWNHYEGYVPEDDNYKVWRHTPGIGWEMIGVAPRDLKYSYNSFTDLNPPAADLWYIVEAVRSPGCEPLKAATLNSSRSNRITKLKEAPESVKPFMDEYNLIVYPNPSEGKFRILMDMDYSDDLDIKVFDLSGKLVYLDELRELSQRLVHEIDLSQKGKGMYHLQLKTSKGVFNSILIVQ